LQIIAYVNGNRYSTLLINESAPPTSTNPSQDENIGNKLLNDTIERKVKQLVILVMHLIHLLWIHNHRKDLVLSIKYEWQCIFVGKFCQMQQ